MTDQDRTRIPAETSLGALVDSCFADLGDAEPFVVERKDEFLGPRHGTATGGCTQLSAWLRTNRDHPVVADFLAETAKKSGGDHIADAGKTMPEAAESANCPGAGEGWKNPAPNASQPMMTTGDHRIATLAPHHPEGSDVAALPTKLKAIADYLDPAVVGDFDCMVLDSAPDRIREAASLIERMEGEYERGLRDAAKVVDEYDSFDRDVKVSAAGAAACVAIKEGIGKLQTRGGEG